LEGPNERRGAELVHWHPEFVIGDLPVVISQIPDAIESIPVVISGVPDATESISVVISRVPDVIGDPPNDNWNLPVII
jgi:hypothetical protein